MKLKPILKLKIIFFALTILATFGLAKSSLAATLNCDGTQPDCQAKINSAVDGDTVRLPAGTFNWGANFISTAAKNIQVVGAGTDPATGTNIIVSVRGFYVYIYDSGMAQFRISNMAFSGTSMDYPLFTIDSAYIPIVHPGTQYWAYGWRLDHIKSNFPSVNGMVELMIYGTNWGLVDHADWTAGGGIAIEQSGGIVGDSPFGGSYDQSQPFDLGGWRSTYIEDTRIERTNPDAGNKVCFDFAGGAGRLVFRHSSCLGALIYSHWTEGGSVLGTKYEVYGNTFEGNNVYNGYPGRMEGGTGVIFNNKVTGYTDPNWRVDNNRSCGDEGVPLGRCDGTSQASLTYDGNVESNGWPCYGQIGRAFGPPGSQPSMPLQAWNNGPESTCLTGDLCTDTVKVAVTPWACSATANYIKSTPHSNGDVDFINSGNTAKPGYSTWPYPYPLTNGMPDNSGGGDTTAPAAPQGLSVQ